MICRPRHPRSERPSRGESHAPRRPRPVIERRPDYPVICPTPTAYQLCALNPRPLDPAAVFARNVREGLADVNAPMRGLLTIERDPHDPMLMTTTWKAAGLATDAYNHLRSLGPNSGTCFSRPRPSDIDGASLKLTVIGSRVLADLEHPLGAGRDPEPAHTDDDDAPPTAPAAPVVYAQRVMNPYRGPATRPALVGTGPLPPRFSTGTRRYMSGEEASV